MRIKKAETPLEQQAIDAHLDRLSLKKSVAGTVEEGSGKISGGANAIAKAGGVANQLDLDGLASLQEKRGLAALLPRKDPSLATKASINSSAELMRGASAAVLDLIDRIGRGEEMEVLKELMHVSDRLKNAADSLENAVGKGTLAHATSADLKTLAGGYRDFLTGWGQLARTISAVFQNVDPLEANHMIALFALAGAHKGGKPKGSSISDLAAGEIAEQAARLLDKAPLFEVGRSHVVSKSSAQPHDALAAEIWDWSMQQGFVAGPHFLTLTQMEQYASARGVSTNDVLNAVIMIRDAQDVHGRLRTWCSESSKPISRFFFTLSEMEQAGKDIGATTQQVMRALDLADEIHEKNAARKGS